MCVKKKKLSSGKWIDTYYLNKAPDVNNLFVIYTYKWPCLVKYFKNMF